MDVGDLDPATVGRLLGSGATQQQPKLDMNVVGKVLQQESPPNFTALDAMSRLYDSWKQGMDNYPTIPTSELGNRWQELPGMEVAQGFGVGGVGSIERAALSAERAAVLAKIHDDAAIEYRDAYDRAGVRLDPNQLAEPGADYHQIPRPKILDMIPKGQDTRMGALRDEVNDIYNNHAADVAEFFNKPAPTSATPAPASAPKVPYAGFDPKEDVLTPTTQSSAPRASPPPRAAAPRVNPNQDRDADILKLIDQGHSYGDIARMMRGVTRGTVAGVVSRRSSGE